MELCGFIVTVDLELEITTTNSCIILLMNLFGKLMIHVVQ